MLTFVNQGEPWAWPATRLSFHSGMHMQSISLVSCAFFSHPVTGWWCWLWSICMFALQLWFPLYGRKLTEGTAIVQKVASHINFARKWTWPQLPVMTGRRTLLWPLATLPLGMLFQHSLKPFHRHCFCISFPCLPCVQFN